MNPQTAVQAFLNEAEDLLARIEEIALELKPGAPAGELIHELFRAFHTLKGSGAMFGFNTVAAFTHHVETALDFAREGRLPITDRLVHVILAARDHIKALLLAAQAEQPAPDGQALVGDLSAILAACAAPASAVVETRLGLSDNAAMPGAAETNSALETFEIHFRPPPHLMAAGTNPASLLDELRALGACRVVADLGRVPALSRLQPDQCHLAWDVTLTTDKGENAIKDVFMFVEDESELSIRRVPADHAAPTLATAGGPSNSDKAKQAPVPVAARVEPASGRARKPLVKDSSVRVPSERLDRLVNLVGELVMNQSRLSQVAGNANVANLAGPVEELERLVDELRDNVLGIRMMPIGTTFSRFKRLVFDLSSELGKEIELETEGEETELDKTVLDQLGEPLVHVIRNSIGHGIETPDERLAAGKPRAGLIRLCAAHAGSNVVITVSDDGRGLDRDAIRAKAVEKGLIAADAELSEREMHELIFRPGFSTAEKLTSVSGRGVGMDVVKRQFEALRGHVSISSERGRGVCLTLTLPLTLAIIDGLLVEINRDPFIVPMSVVTETVELARSAREQGNGRNVIAIRGELVPYVPLRETFRVPGEAPEVAKVVVVRHGGDRVGLVVDRVLGNHQTVIQSLGRFYRDVELVSGATIMGDGRVALILDLGGLVRVAEAEGSVARPSTFRDSKTTTAAA